MNTGRSGQVSDEKDDLTLLIEQSDRLVTSVLKSDPALQKVALDVARTLNDIKKSQRAAKKAA